MDNNNNNVSKPYKINHYNNAEEYCVNILQ